MQAESTTKSTGAYILENLGKKRAAHVPNFTLTTHIKYNIITAMSEY